MLAAKIGVSVEVGRCCAPVGERGAGSGRWRAFRGAFRFSRTLSADAFLGRFAILGAFRRSVSAKRSAALRAPPSLHLQAQPRKILILRTKVAIEVESANRAFFPCSAHCSHWLASPPLASAFGAPLHGATPAVKSVGILRNWAFRCHNRYFCTLLGGCRS